MGLEYISQPQVFTAPITALQGIQGINEAYPLLTTYQFWTSTAVIPTSTFPIPGLWTMLDSPGSFLIAISGVLQPATKYTIDRNNRLVNFNFVISADTEVSFTQLATHAPSSQSFNYIESISSQFVNLSANNAVIQSLTTINVITDSLTATNLLVTNLTALSSVLNIVDVTQYELSGFNILGNANIVGDTTVTGLISANNITTNALSALSYVITDNGSLIGTTSATTINIGALSARTLDLIHSPANDGVDPIFNIGETGTEGFSGIRIRYEEPTNRLFLTSRTGSTILTSAIVNVATGEVGISGMPVPGEALTVYGDVSASGLILAANSPRYYYLDNNRSAIGNATLSTTFFDASAGFSLQPSKRYEMEYNLYYSKNIAGNLVFGLSTIGNLSQINAFYFQSNIAGIGTNNTTTGGGIVSAAPGTLMVLPSTGALATGTNHFTRVLVQTETSATNLPLTTLVTVLCCGTGTITPLKGSYRKITLLP